MNAEPPISDRSISRRRLLAGGATAASIATSGCVRRVRSIVARSPDNHLSLSIATVPADDDPQATQIAGRLQEALEVAGIDADIEHLPTEDLYRKVLVNHDFDIFVMRHPGGVDPDFLYEALHSTLADEWGWQNPFGFTNIPFDDLLETQRDHDGDERREAVAGVLRAVADEQPFVSVCVPDEYRLVREDRFEGWDEYHLADRLAYLRAEPVDDDVDELRGVITDPRTTENLNPLSVEYRNRGTVVDLLYDSLAAIDGGEFVPWLAKSWGWDASTAIVSLRRARWHDGEPLTAEDVAFTYRFLEDTSLGNTDITSPSPRYRGRATAVDRVRIVDDRTLRLSTTASREVTEYAFTVPILPSHIWRDRTETEELPGIDVAEGTTTAVVTDNIPPIGSGPFAFDDRAEREWIQLERFDGHFSLDAEELPATSVERFRIHVEPRTANAVEAIEAGNADVTISTLNPDELDEVGDGGGERRAVGLRPVESAPRTHYSIGFNTRTAPLSNPYFRRTVASLLDKERIVEEIFAGRAKPVATPLTGEWVPDDLEWDGVDPVVPFIGADGELDELEARAAFEEIGYRYDDEGNFLVRN